MAAGTQYSKSLNLDVVGVKTPAGYDSAIDEWVMTEKLVGGLARTAILQSGATANGNGTSMDVSELATVIFDVQGTFSATINFEGTTDDTVWAPILVTAMGAGTITATTTTTGLYRAVVTGLKSVRARISGYSSGSITVKARGTPLTAPSKAVQLTGSSIQDSQAVPIKKVNKLVTLANAVAIDDTKSYLYNLVAAGIPTEEVRRYRFFRITFYNTLNQPLNVWVSPVVPARNIDYAAPATAIYNASNAVAADGGLLVLQGGSGGSGSGNAIAVIPALINCVYSNIFISISCSTAPTTGSVSITVEMGE